VTETLCNPRLKLPEPLWPVFDGPAEYRGAYGGRGGAKTIAFANMAIAEILKPTPKPWHFLCGRELQKSLKDSVFSVIAAQIDALGVADAFDVGKEFIRCKNGNDFLFYGLRSNIAEVKGLHGVRRTWLEEAQKVSQSSLTYLVPTVMRDFPDCEIWATWNPDDEDDPIHKMFVTDADASVKCVKINYTDNPWFPASLNKVRLRDLKFNPERYDWIWNGNFNVNAEGAVYAKWINARENAGAFVKGLYDPTLPVHTAWDIGRTDYTTIWLFQVIRGEIRCIDYIANNRENLDYYAGQLFGYEFKPDTMTDKGKVLYKRGDAIPGLERRRSYRYGKHHVPHDAIHRTFAAGGRSVIEQGLDFGLQMLYTPALPQQMQISTARKTIEQCWFDPETCADGIRCLRKYQFEFDEQRQRYKDKPNHDVYSDGADSFELLSQVWKSPIVEVAKPEPRYFNDLTADELFWPKAQEHRERI
jgi:phage terminase large subunit